MKPKHLLLILIFSLCCKYSQAIEKKRLSIADFDTWKSLEDIAISQTGAWLLYSEMPQEGDGRLIIQHTSLDTAHILPRGYNAKFSADGNWAITLIKPPFQDTRQAKIAKKKDPDLPKDSLAVKHNLEQRQNRKDLSRRMQQFFDHYLQGAPQPAWMKYGVPATMKGKTWGFETE